MPRKQASPKESAKSPARRTGKRSAKHDVTGVSESDAPVYAGAGAGGGAGARKSEEASQAAFDIQFARPGDEAIVAGLIRDLSIYEKMENECIVTPEAIREQLFGARPAAEALIARVGGTPAAFALFFQNFSTFLARPGLYLEDLFVKPEYRKLGIGTALLRRMASLCVERGYGRMEWATLEWNELAKGRWRAIGAVPMKEWCTWRLTGAALREMGQPQAQAQEQGKAQPKTKTPPALSAPAAAPSTPPFAPPSSGSVSSASARHSARQSASASAKRVVIYTDGGCVPNPGMGAWAAVLDYNGRTKELCGGELDTTNNRMEMTAAIMALEALKEPCQVEIFTDSEYLKRGITEWVPKWKRQGWRRGKGPDSAPVKNVDLWKRLETALAPHKVEWNWVMGHAGNPANERCDALCRREIERMLQEK